jgi:hypothetical protein
MSKNNIIKLKPEKIIETIEVLERRISDRFPDSGLRNTCQNFLDTAKKTKRHIEWIATPNLAIRLSSYFVILLGIGVLVYSIFHLDLKIQNTKLSNIVTLTESLFNEVILIGAAIFFLITIESKIKRKRAINKLNVLRVMVHVIDMHQLTKDPSFLLHKLEKKTKNSPDRKLTQFELERYLDYCSELTSLIAKVAALYAQSLPDQIVVRTVNEIETLCTGLSRKIWQKLIILNLGKMS